jgi:hypothetical protein
MMLRSTWLSAAKLTSAPDYIRVGDIALDKRIARRVDLLEVVEVARIGQLVQVDDMDLGVRAQLIAHERRADEARPAGDHDPFHADSSRRCI